MVNRDSKQIDDYAKHGGPGDVWLLGSFYHESLCAWIKTIVNKFAISNHTALILGVRALRSYLKLICEYELHSLPNKKVSAPKDHGKNYIKVTPPLVRHLLRNRLLLQSNRKRQINITVCYEDENFSCGLTLEIALLGITFLLLFTNSRIIWWISCKAFPCTFMFWVVEEGGFEFGLQNDRNLPLLSWVNKIKRD